MTGPEWNSKSNLKVSLDFVSWNTEILGKQNSLFLKGQSFSDLLYEGFGAKRRTYHFWGPIFISYKIELIFGMKSIFSVIPFLLICISF